MDELNATPTTIRNGSLDAARMRVYVRGLMACLAGLCLAVFSAENAAAQSIDVTLATDDGSGLTVGTLSYAIEQANAGAFTTINFNVPGGIVTLTGTSLPDLIAPAGGITITGNSHTLDADGRQAFWISPALGNVTIADLTIQDAVAQGGAGAAGNGGGGGGLGGGGAIYIDQFATATISNVTFTGNQAIGGAGGAGTGAGNGGAGGGFNVNGNAAIAGTGGGAGGAPGNGANSGYGGGGGGDGVGGTAPGGSGNGGGTGGGPGVGGDGGLALGGAVFVGNGGTLTILSSTSIDGSNTATGGAGGVGSGGNGTAGNGNGGALYVGIGTTSIFDTSGTDINVAGNIFSNGTINVQGGNATVNWIGGTTTQSTAFGGGTINVNSGTLNGTTNSLTGNIVVNNLGTGHLRFTQTGTGVVNANITGAGDVTIAGTGTVIYAAAQAYTGGTTVTNTATLLGATSTLSGTINTATATANVQFAQDFDGTYSGSLTGSGNLIKTGAGNVTLGNTSYGGTTTISAGKLTVNGTNQSDFNIAAAGTLGGNSTITGNVVNSGTVSPGNSIGTTQINGNYTANVGSNQVIEIQPSAAPVAGTDNDLINATGTATINGGTVSVLGNAGAYTNGATYTFLQAAGGRAGNFSGITDNLTFFDASLVYGGTFAAFTLTRNNASFVPFAQTPNQQAVAAYIDQTGPGATGDYATVVDAVASLPTAQLPNAFDQMSGTIYPSAASFGIQQATNMVFTLRRQTRLDTLFQPLPGMESPLVQNDDDSEEEDIVYVSYQKQANSAEFVPVLRTRRVRRPVWNGWNASYGTYDNGVNNGGRFGGAGNMTSIYRNISGGLKFGLFGAYNHARLEQGFPVQSVSVDDGQFGSYLRADVSEAYFLSVSSFGIDSYQGRREIQFGAINRLANSSYDGTQFTQYFEAGAKVLEWPFDMEPFLGLQYTRVNQDSFTETGADALNLNVNGITADGLETLFGTHLATDVGSVRPEIRAIWIHEFMSSTATMTSTFAGAGGVAFPTTGLDLGNDWGLIGSGLSWFCTDRLTFTANYDALFTDATTFHMGSGSVQFHW
ncbi:MAG: autotransporter domain-containing protein [Planctomycetaceae bacterium]|nr:autotransporter domain-containing protein [Planctomycetaceae bacterium]